LKRRAFFEQAKAGLYPSVVPTWLGIAENQALAIRLLTDFRNLSNPGMMSETSGGRHYYENLARACRRLAMDLGNSRRHSADAARARALEWLSAATV
jgi:hypothetical protein